MHMHEGYHDMLPRVRTLAAKIPMRRINLGTKKPETEKEEVDHLLDHEASVP